MKKDFTYSLIVCALFVISFAVAQLYLTPHEVSAASYGSSYSNRTFSGGKITKSPSKLIDQKRSECESGGVCNGTCTNTWSDTSSATCSGGTFSLDVYGPNGAASEYCIPASAKGSGRASSGKYILDTYKTSTTQLGTCTCTSGPYCAVVTVSTVTADMAQVKKYSISQ